VMVTGFRNATFVGRFLIVAMFLRWLVTSFH